MNHGCSAIQTSHHLVSEEAKRDFDARAGMIYMG